MLPICAKFRIPGRHATAEVIGTREPQHAVVEAEDRRDCGGYRDQQLRVRSGRLIERQMRWVEPAGSIPGDECVSEVAVRFAAALGC